MDLVGIAIAILWVIVGIAVFALAVYLLLKALKIFWPAMDDRVEQAILLIAGVVVLIAILMALTGRASVPRFWGKADLLPRPGMLTFNERDFGTPHAGNTFNHGEPWPAIATVCSFNGCKSRPIGFDI